VQLCQDEVLSRAERTVQNSQNLNLHGLGLSALEYGPRGGHEAAVHLA
jgi:hypothetical protein